MTGLSGWLGVVLDCPDPRALGGFYRDLHGWELYVAPLWPAETGGPQMMVHLDVGVSGDVADLERAAGEAVALGATQPEHQPQDDVRVLLDPAGHPFCLYLDNDDD